jgi:uncharacterized protein (DUF2236 family)
MTGLCSRRSCSSRLTHGGCGVVGEGRDSFAISQEVVVLNERSVSWRYVGDVRILPFLGRAFLLQAAHPTIAAGVADHSIFKTDPFGRLQQSWGLVLNTLYAADGERVGAEVRAGHKCIKGVTADGRRYHAFEPEAYFWVLASGFETIVVTAERFGRPMTASEERRMYDETRELGRRFGLRDRDMPDTYGSFQGWYAWMLEERIENNRTVRDVLAVLRHPAPPKAFPGVLWPLPRTVAARLGWLTTVGTLTPRVRERLDITWNRVQEVELSAIARAFRTLDIVPTRWCYLAPAREAFARSKRTAAAAPEGTRDGRVAA